MKTFFKNLAIMLAISIAALSCSEDIWVHDGADGRDGIDGKDGHSIVTKVEPVYSNEGNLLGNMTSYYLDIDDSFNYTEGDIFQNSFIIFNGKDGQDGENGKDGIDGKDGLDASLKISLLSPTPGCPNGSFLLESYKGEELIGTLSICVPQGKNGYNLVQEYVEVKFNNGDGDVTGTETKTYWDIDGDGEVSEGDEYKGGFITWNGRDGVDGKDGTTPNITFELVEGFLVITSTLDGVIVSQVNIEIPEDGEDGSNGKSGMTPSLRAIKFLSHWECNGNPGIMYIWYFDENGDGIDQPEEVVSKYFLCGCDCESQSESFIPAPSIDYMFNNPGNSWYYWELGFLFEKNLISINQIGSPEGNGTVTLHKYGANWAEFYTPEFPQSSITAVEMDVPSRSTWKVELLFILSDGTALVVHSQVIEGKSDVIWYDTNTYPKKKFIYYVALDKLKYHDVVRLGFRVHKYGSWECLDRNHSFNGDNLRIARVIKVK